MGNLGMTTEQHAEAIAASLINGLRWQAAERYAEAKAEHCDTVALLRDLADITGMEDTLEFTCFLLTQKGA